MEIVARGAAHISHILAGIPKSHARGLLQFHALVTLDTPNWSCVILIPPSSPSSSLPPPLHHRRRNNIRCTNQPQREISKPIHDKKMRRPVTIVATVIAGTAVRFLLSRLRPPKPKRPRNPHVLYLLNRLAPQSHPPANHPHTECTFCLDRIRRSDKVRLTPCNHIFHADCLEQWVLFTAEQRLNVAHYSLRDDGKVECAVRKPTCPNCATVLDVVPGRLQRSVILLCVARSLNLRCLAAAEQMLDAGLVWYEERPDHLPHEAHTNNYFQQASRPHQTIQYPQPIEAIQSPSSRVSTTVRISTAPASSRRRAPSRRYVRADSTLSEPPTELQEQTPRRSLPDHSRLMSIPVLTRAEQRGWRRAKTFTTPISVVEAG